MADYVSGDGKCGAPAPNGASGCALPKGHPGGHRNAWSTAKWPNERPLNVTATLPHGPGMQKCGHVGPFDGMTCERAVGHSGIHEHPRAGMKMVWSDVTEESMAKQLAGLQRKVRAQANQINKLEELRRTAATKQPEYVQLANRLNEETHHLKSQASLTERENRFRRTAEQQLDSERERRGQLITALENDIRRALGNPPITGPSTWAALRTQVELLIKELVQQQTFRAEVHREHSAVVKRSSDRFYQLADFLGVATAGETWDTLFQRVGQLKENHELTKTVAEMTERSSTERRDLNRLIGLVGAENWNNRRHLVSVTDLGDVAEGLRSALVKLERRTDELAMETVRRCESWNSGMRCVGYTRHNGAHHGGSGTERWT